jgi:uncharacterized membrane protein
MALLILGLVLFLGTHAFTMAREPRATLVARLGEGPYKGLYALLTIAGVVLIAIGFGRYRAAGYIPVWDPPVWTRHLSLILVWPAFIMFVAAYFPGRIKGTLKHPMLAGVKLWAAAHLLANGDLGSIVLFGSILAWAVAARISAKRRDEVADHGGPATFRWGPRNDLIAIAIGTLIWLAFLFRLHTWLIGVPVLPRVG